MSADIMAAVSAMVRLYDMLRLPRAGQAVAWEMDKATAESLAQAFGTSAPVDVTDPDVLCMGIPVTIVERPGIRLVFTVIDR